MLWVKKTYKDFLIWRQWKNILAETETAYFTLTSTVTFRYEQNVFPLSFSFSFSPCSSGCFSFRGHCPSGRVATVCWDIFFFLAPLFPFFQGGGHGRRWFGSLALYFLNCCSQVGEWETGKKRKETRVRKRKLSSFLEAQGDEISTWWSVQTSGCGINSCCRKMDMKTIMIDRWRDMKGRGLDRWWCVINAFRD